MDRRNFIFNSISLAAGSLGLSMYLSACGTQKQVQASNKSGLITLPLQSFKNEKGEYREMVSVNAEGVPYVIFVFRKTESEFTALKGMCTHNACDLNPVQTGLDCPCHGSRFNKEGTVLNGPASKNLTRYFTSVSGNDLLINLNKVIP